MKKSQNTPVQEHDHFIDASFPYEQDNVNEAVYASGDDVDDDDDSEDDNGDWGNVDPLASPDGLSSDNEPTAPGSAV